MDEVWLCQSQTILSVRCGLEAHQFSSLSNYAAIASALSSRRSSPLVSSLASIHRITGMALPPLLIIRSEEHTSELQSLMRISYAVFCLKKKNKKIIQYNKRKYVNHKYSASTT